MRHSLRALHGVADRDGAGVTEPAKHETVSSGVVNDSLKILHPG